MSESTSFPPNSRYAGSETREFRLRDGRLVRYLGRRFVPPADRFTTLGVHLVEDGDRLDRLANDLIGDPEQFWRICDGNSVLHPEEVTATVNREVRITLPEGIPGAPDA